MSCSAKKLFYSGCFAGKIDPVLCVAGKMKYICWETFTKLFIKWALLPRRGENFVLKFGQSLKIC